ncbi:xanthotoxin 5-hydroxylase CYP82C4-like [Rhodamnia argentea]|uniref:Xanthotoxin 5-hydroxylase CYP82C4-like n=1 Tax=Rhodamnia argentea TaxID=178133 RepID=A0A8B8NM97_9MYRT|nr:xanthotoxin 5-hydroxylase CYP82C4-like [Rhodamnia argentea]
MGLLSLDLQKIGLAVLLVIIYLYASLHRSKRSNKTGQTLPEAAGAWPLLGHLHLLGPNKLLHRILAAMADQYGPAFSIRLGIHRVLVVSNWEVAKECFTLNDRVFPTRPRSLSVKLMGYDHAMFGFAPYGPYWRGMRKLAVVELLSNHRLDMLKHVRDAETNLLVKGLYEKWLSNGENPVTVDMEKDFGHVAMNITVRMVAGKRYLSGDKGDEEESTRCQKALGDFFFLVGQFMVSDAIPFLGWLDVVKGRVAEMKRTAEELDWVLGRWVENHRKRRAAAKVEDDEQDFIHFMLSATELEDGKYSVQEADTIIKATCLSVILGGNDTTVLTLTWALSLLLNNHHSLERAQDELDVQVGEHRQVEESDIKNLTYLQAIVKETLRLYPVLPLSVQREAMEDCTVAGFHVPAGTRLMVNLWKLQRDPRIWSRASDFQPERFLTDHVHVDVRGHSFEYIPFGSGRRMCPGVSFGLQVVQLILARLLHAFKLERISGSEVDMSESPGLTMPRATPLEVVLTPRLPATFY